MHKLPEVSTPVNRDSSQKSLVLNLSADSYYLTTTNALTAP